MVPRYTLPRVRAAPGVQQQGKARQLALGDWFVMRPIGVGVSLFWLPTYLPVCVSFVTVKHVIKRLFTLQQ